MKKIMILILILMLVLTACSKVQEQPLEDKVVENVNEDVENDVDVVQDIVENVEPTEGDDSLYSNNFEPNRQLLIGSYKIYEDDGDLILEFSDDFEVGRNDDINVYLSNIGRPSESEHVFRGEYVIVGDLVKPRGMQKYEIPLNTNLIDFKSVVLLDPTTGIVHGSARLTK